MKKLHVTYCPKAAKSVEATIETNELLDYTQPDRQIANRLVRVHACSGASLCGFALPLSSGMTAGCTIADSLKIPG